MSHTLNCSLSGREVQMLADAGLRFQQTRQGTRYRLLFATERDAEQASSLLQRKREQQPETARGRHRS